MYIYMICVMLWLYDMMTILGAEHIGINHNTNSESTYHTHPAGLDLDNDQFVYLINGYDWLEEKYHAVAYMWGWLATWLVTLSDLFRVSRNTVEQLELRIANICNAISKSTLCYWCVPDFLLKSRGWCISNIKLNCEPSDCVLEFIICYDIPNSHISDGYYQSRNTQLQFQCLWRPKGEMCIFEWRMSCYKPWVNFPHVGLETLLIFTCLQHTTMGWVHPSFRQILLDHCDEYIDSSDRGSDKTRSKLITRIAKDITEIAEAAVETILLPSDVEKVINWLISVSSNTDLCL